MKTFEIEFRRESYVVLTVEADTEEQAEEMAWKQLYEEYRGAKAGWEIFHMEQA